ncbi:MAG: hypothetical protein ACTSO2_09750 [Promethearchaeota archaeon]
MELLQEFPSRGINYIGPYKKYNPIKKMITDYLQNGGDYVKPYTIKGSPSKQYKKGQMV